MRLEPVCKIGDKITYRENTNDPEHHSIGLLSQIYREAIGKVGDVVDVQWDAVRGRWLYLVDFHHHLWWCVDSMITDAGNPW